jgi:hypothetical protein
MRLAFTSRISARSTVLLLHRTGIASTIWLMVMNGASYGRGNNVLMAFSTSVSLKPISMTTNITILAYLF